MLKTFPTALCQGCDMPLDGLLGYAVLIVDYNTEYLHFALCDVSLGVALIEAEVQFPDLGEKAAPEPLSSQEDMIDLPFYHKVRGALSSFVESAEAHPEQCAAEYKEIILSGEAETTIGMMQALTEDFSEARGEIKLVKNEDIDLFYAGAIGAAPAAKKQVDGPKKTRDFISMPDCTAEVWDKLW